MTISFFKFLPRLALVWFGLVLFGTFLFGTRMEEVSGQGAPVSYIDELRVKELNDKAIHLIIQASSIRGVIGVQTATQRDDLMKVLQERKEALSNLIEKDPALALQNAVLKDYRSRIPIAMRSYVESDFLDEGRAEVVHIDNFEKDISRYDYFLGSKENRKALYFSNNQPRMLSGAQVNVRGVELDNKVAVSNFRVQSPIQALSADTMGDQKTLVILVNFPNDKKIQEPYWKEEVIRHVNACTFTDNNSANKFYQEASFDKISFSGDVIGPYTILDSANQKCDIFNLLNKVMKIVDKDVNFPNYQRLVVVTTDSNGCMGSAAGMGTVGKWRLHSEDGDFEASVTWIRLDNTTNRILSHELGHNLGLWHAHSLSCPAGSSIDDLNSCKFSEYGDFIDVMGSGGAGLGGDKPPTHINASYKEFLGWIPKGIIVDKSGTYEIAPIEKSSSLPQLLKIPKGGDWYTLEYRQPIGFDSQLSRSLEKQSAWVRFNKRYSSEETFLLGLGDIRKPGQIFNDSIDDITIKHINQTPEKLTVEINGDLKGPPAVDVKINGVDDRPLTLAKGTVFKIGWKGRNVDSCRGMSGIFTAGGKNWTEVEIPIEGQESLIARNEAGISQNFMYAGVMCHNRKDNKWPSDMVRIDFADSSSGIKGAAGISSKSSPLGVQTPQGISRTLLSEQQQPPPIFRAELLSGVALGKVPLVGVDLNARVAANTEGSISYTFYCNRSDINTNITSDWDAKYDGVSDFSKKAEGLCSYSKTGKYTPKVIVEQGDLVTQAQTEIIVEASKEGLEMPPQSFLPGFCEFTANPETVMLIPGKITSSMLNWNCKNVRLETCSIQSPPNGPTCVASPFSLIDSCRLSPFEKIGQYAYRLICRDLNEIPSLEERTVTIKSFLYETR